MVALYRLVARYVGYMHFWHISQYILGKEKSKRKGQFMAYCSNLSKLWTYMGNSRKVVLHL